MSDTAWQRAKTARELYLLLDPDYNPRKLRRFVLACLAHLLPPNLISAEANVLTFAEMIADDEANIDPDEWTVTFEQLQNRVNAEAPDSTAWLLSLTVGESASDEAHWMLESLRDRNIDETVPIALFRDIFGNPFRPVNFTPWRTDTAVSLAQQMYESRDFGAMPILADALQDAGCDNDEVLNHCRGQGPHVRGCWVVDGVLGFS